MMNPSDVEAATGTKVVAIETKKKCNKYLVAGGALALVFLAAGVTALCVGVFNQAQGGASVSTTTTTTSAPIATGTASDGCAYQGKIYNFGAKWRCCDGCNICMCEADGSVGMTEKACDPNKYENTCKKAFPLKSPPPPSPSPSPSPSPASSPPSASPSPAPAPPPAAASPSPDTNDEMDAPDPAVLAARDQWMAAIFGDASSESAAPASLHVSVTDAPAVVAASDATMQKVEKKLNERLASQDETTEAAESGKSLTNYGFAILEESTAAAATESATGPTAPTFKETRVNIDEDDGLASSLASILALPEAHTGAPKAPADEDDALLGAGDDAGSRRQLKVIGADGRAQVSCGNAHGHSAFKTVVAFHSKGSNWAYCSGTLIAPDVVLTAGHCIHDKDDGGWQWPDRVSVQSCSSADAWRTYKPKQMMAWTAWTTKEQKEYDIALVKLHAAPDYRKTGWLRPFYPQKNAGDLFGWKSFGWHNGMTDKWNFIVAGHPGDKQRAHGHSTMWWDHDRMCKSSDKAACAGNPKQDYIRYQIDTAGGQSGSGVFHWGSANGATHNRIYAVHANGWYGGPNGGPRITRPKFLQMCAFISNSRVC